MRKKHALSTERIMEVYMEYPHEIGNEQIKKIFDVSSDTTCRKIKKEVKEFAIKNNREMKAVNKNNVDTLIVLEYAHVDIDEVERCYKKLQEFSL